MAWYKYETFLHHNTDVLFDKTFGPGEDVPHSGIYRCHNCGKEAACNHLDRFPPQNHHQHEDRNKPIAWRLIVATQN